jgi:hypothetical protein
MRWVRTSRRAHRVSPARARLSRCVATQADPRSLIARFLIAPQDDAKLAEAMARISEKRPDLPYFQPEDVIIEWDQCLGEGGFCTAYRAVWGGAWTRAPGRFPRRSERDENAHRVSIREA